MPSTILRWCYRVGCGFDAHSGRVQARHLNVSYAQSHYKLLLYFDFHSPHIRVSKFFLDSCFFCAPDSLSADLIQLSCQILWTLYKRLSKERWQGALSRSRTSNVRFRPIFSFKCDILTSHCVLCRCNNDNCGVFIPFTATGRSRRNGDLCRASSYSYC